MQACVFELVCVFIGMHVHIVYILECVFAGICGLAECIKCRKVGVC